MRSFARFAGCRRYVLLALALIGGSDAVGAQQAAVPPRLTLQEAIAYAQRTNPEHLQAVNDTDVAEAGVRSSWGALLPNLNTSLGFGGAYSRTLRAVDEFGRPLSQPEPVTSETSSASQGLSMSMTLFDGGSSWATIGAARANVAATDARIASAANTLGATVARQYYEALRAERRITLERELLVFAEERLRILEEQFRIAAARQTDVLGARSDLSRQRQAIAEAESNARARRLDLLQTLGVSGEPDFELATDLSAILDPATLDGEAMVARALTSSPQIVAARAAVRQAEKQASASRGRRLPTVSLSGNFGRGDSDRGLFTSWGQFNPENRSASFNLNVSLPVFTRFQMSQQIAQSEAAADDARHAERAAQLQVERDVRAALIELQRAFDALRLAEEQAEITALRLELAQEEYRAGSSSTNFTTLQQITESNQQAQRQALEARFSYMTARINLEERLGGSLDGGD
jgi:outer membrane protein